MQEGNGQRESFTQADGCIYLNIVLETHWKFQPLFHAIITSRHKHRPVSNNNLYAQVFIIQKVKNSQGIIQYIQRFTRSSYPLFNPAKYHFKRLWENCVGKSKRLAFLSLCCCIGGTDKKTPSLFFSSMLW